MSRVALKRSLAAPRAKPLALEYPRGWIKPCLASEMVGQVPIGAQWVREIKFDGYRTQLHLREGTAVLYSRNGNNWTSRYESIAAALLKLPARHAIIDAEM